MKNNFRAILLAAGYGTRLRPITLETPKCLVPIQGIPILGHWLCKLEKAGCNSVIVNTHYMSEEVEHYLGSWKNTAMKIQAINDPKLLGTAGTLLRNRRFFKGYTGLLIHADNMMEDGLDDFITAHHHRQEECILTMLTFETDSPSSCGIVEIDEKRVVQGFHEKIQYPPGNEANGALYAFDENFIESLSMIKPEPSDFSTEVIPKYLGQIQSWRTDKRYMDIGTPKALVSAQEINWGEE